MKCFEFAWLATSVLLAHGLAWGGEPQSALPAKFAPLARPALEVRAPERAVLLAGTPIGTRIVCVGEHGLIAFSDDNGATWRQARAVPTSISLTAVKATPDGQLFTVGHSGVILQSSDRGESWTLLADGQRLAANAASVADALSAHDPVKPRAVREALQLVNDGPDKPLLDLGFQDGRHGIVVGAYGLAFATDDGGASWHSVMHRLDNPKALHLYAVAIQGDTWMLAGEQGLLFRSRDGGRSFVRLASPYEGSWFALAATGARHWSVVGLRGHAFYSDDDGDHWQALDGAPPVSFVSAAGRADGSLILTNQAGQLFKGRGREVLQPLAVPPLPPLSQSVVTAQGDIVALGLAGAMRLPGAAK